MADIVNPVYCYKYANVTSLARGGIFNIEHADA